MTALDWPALQFQTPDRTVGVTLSGGTYTLRQARGQSRRWEVDLTSGTVNGVATRALGGHRMVGPTDSDVATLGTSGVSAWERALTVYPSGGTQTFIGTLAHGYEEDTAISVTVDGATVTPTGTATEGTEVVIRRTSMLHHPDADHIGDAVTTYTMNADGLTVAWSVTWLRALVGGQCYGAMMPCGALLDTGKTLTGAKATLTADDDSMKSSSQSRTAWLWDADGGHGACMALLDLSAVADWAYTDAKDMWLQDRSGGTNNKVYAGFTGRNAAAGDTWQGLTRYMADYFDAGAAVTLDK